jgi:spore maturation protein CgeB
MKILLIGSDFEYAIEKYYKKYLRNFGCEIYHYDAPDIVYRNHSKNILNKILFKTGIYKGYGRVNRELLEITERFQPDIIWVWKGLEIYPATLKKLKGSYRLVNFNPDHPFIIIASANGNKNIRNSVGLYDLHFCYHVGLKKMIEEKYHIPTCMLPFAFDRVDAVYQEPENISEIKRICFQANPDAYRVSRLEKLTDAGLEVDVFGIGWNKTRLKSDPKIRINPIAPRARFWQLNQEYRIQLNLFREYNNDSHNMRTFEIPAVGGIQLSPYSKDQETYFKEESEIFFFRDDDEMIAQAKKILGMSKQEADEIRNNARARSLTSRYSFEDRAITVFETLTKMEEGKLK